MDPHARTAQIERLADELAFYRTMIAIERTGPPQRVRRRRGDYPFWISTQLIVALMRWQYRYRALGPSAEERRAILFGHGRRARPPAGDHA